LEIFTKICSISTRQHEVLEIKKLFAEQLDAGKRGRNRVDARVDDVNGE
jgi:hypothetical protein